MIKHVLDPMIPHPYRIHGCGKKPTVIPELKPTNGARELSFAADSSICSYVLGVGEVPISISDDPTKPKTLVHTTHVVGTVTKAMHKPRQGNVPGLCINGYI